MLGPACGCEHPGAEEKRRLMTDMLTMSASQVGNPITLFVHMKPDDRLVHRLTVDIKSVASDSLFAGKLRLSFFKRSFRPNCGRHKPPTLFCILVETSDENNLSIEMLKLGKRHRTLPDIDHSGIKLADDIDLAFRRDIEIAAAGAPRIREQIHRVRTATGTLDHHCQIMPG